MRLLTVAEVQERLLTLMKVVDVFCHENALDYYMIGGTLLGAVRHGGFIPWDDDIDIAMLRPEYERFLSLAHTFPKPYEVYNYTNCKTCDYVITRIYIPDTYIDQPAAKKVNMDHRLYFDIFPIDKVPDGEEEQHCQRKRIAKLKKNIWLAVPYQYSHSLVKRIGRKIISLAYSPFRNRWLKSLDKEMKRYEKEVTTCYCSMASQYKYEKQKMRCEIYGEPRLYQFCDIMLKGPAMATEYLTQLYGKDYMDLPPVEKRRKGFDIYVTEDV